MAIPLPDPSAWSGRDRPFSTAEQRSQLLAGAPFMILDAVADFGGTPPPGEKPQIGLLVQFCGPDERLLGESFVWTKAESPSRLRLVDLVTRAREQDDVVGPVRVVLIDQDDPSRKPFQHIAPYRPDDPESSREPVRARASRAVEQEADPDAIPY